MADEKNRNEVTEEKELELDDLEKVSGGLFMDHVETQKTTPISQNTKDNI